MSIVESKTSWFPALNGRGLDMVKILAAVFMVIDHINFILLDNTIFEMGFIGRATYPLFAYALAVAFWRTDNDSIKQYGIYIYAKRLLILAILSEPISYLTRDIGMGNVIFTLAFAALFIALTHHLKKSTLYMIYAVAIVVQGLPPLFEFGVAGVVLPAVMLQIFRGDKSAYPFLFIFITIFNMTDYIGVFLQPDQTWMGVMFIGLYYIVGCSILPMVVLTLCKKADQTKRYLSKYFLHIFYPSHLFLIWGFQYMWGLI